MVFSRLHSVSSRPDNGGASGSNGDDRPVTPGNHPIELSISIESPPCVMYGSATESSGALLSGLLNLKVKDPYKNNKLTSTKSTPLRSTSAGSALSSTSSLNISSSSGAALGTTSLNTKRKSGLFTSLSNLTIAPSNDSLSNSNNTISRSTDINKSNNIISNGSKSISTRPKGKPASNLKIMSGYTKLPIASVTLSLVQTIHYHKPFLPDNSHILSCNSCRKKVTAIKKWEIQTDVIDKPVGTHSYPFSYLIPGSVPSTCCLGAHSDTQVKYELVAQATYLDPKQNNISNGSSKSRSSKKDGKLLKLIMPVPVTRSIARGPDKNSLRVFPPTELTAAAVLPNVVYPKSTFPLELKLDGVSSEDRRWRMRKLAWRIEETTKIRGHSCSLHKANLSQLEKEVRRKEVERSKKPAQAIKRYGDIGPQIKVTVATPENLPIRVSSNASSSGGQRSNSNDGDTTNNSISVSNPNTSGSEGVHVTTNNTGLEIQSNRPNGNRRPVRRNAQGMQDTDDDDNEEGNDTDSLFIHPSDDALRQEILQQQRKMREEQLKKEMANNNSTLFTEEVRIISKGEMKHGWKTDFDNNGKIELVTDIDCMGLNSGIGNPVMFSSTSRPYVNPHKSLINVACDVQDPNLGIYVSHILAVEIVVAEETLQYANGQPINKSKSKNSSDDDTLNADQRLAELSPMFANRNNKKAKPVSNDDHPTLSPHPSRNDVSAGGSGSGTTSTAALSKIVSVPTGAARVLRMQFRLNVTERSGLGISWDEEVPPIYQDVKHSAPPTYETTVAVLPSYSVQADGDVELGFNEFGIVNGITKSSSNRMTMNITPPPMAHHGSLSGPSNSSNNPLSTVQSPQLENVISIQGNVPFRNNILTPSNTQNLGVRNNISELFDTDRITQ